MQIITIDGNIGRDAETRRAGSDDVCAFSVGVKQGYGDKSSTNWFRCNLWGKRGEKLAQYLTKGTKVVVVGELTIGEYQGKPQYDVRVNEVVLMAGQSKAQHSHTGAHGGQDDGFDDDMDSVPF